MYPLYDVFGARCTLYDYSIEGYDVVGRQGSVCP